VGLGGVAPIATSQARGPHRRASAFGEEGADGSGRHRELPPAEGYSSRGKGPADFRAHPRAGFTLSLIHGLSVPSGIDNRLKIGEISLKSTDKEGQIQISIINDLSLIIDANRSIYRKFG